MTVPVSLRLLIWKLRIICMFGLGYITPDFEQIRNMENKALMCLTINKYKCFEPIQTTTNEEEII